MVILDDISTLIKFPEWTKWIGLLLIIGVIGIKIPLLNVSVADFTFVPIFHFFVSGINLLFGRSIVGNWKMFVAIIAITALLAFMIHFKKPH